MDPKPIPALYCCYLLRSSVRHASLYVGSTPNPARRLRQHNGHTKGGASRTARRSLRPWEMACIVTGFPSNFAALQFEWAWQNTHLTRRVADSERISAATTKAKVNKKTGRVRHRPGRPSMNLSERLANLHLLLEADSFARWPLEVRFFAEDVYNVWQKRCSHLGRHLQEQFKIFLDKPVPSAVSEGTELSGGFASIDPSYQPVKAHLEKSAFLLAEGEDVTCAICQESVNFPQTRTMLVCPMPGCQSTTHMPCLARHFLKSQSEDAALPKAGTCPSCHSELQWVDLVRELSLRTRGEKEVAKLQKKRREKKSKAKGSTAVADEADSSDLSELDDEDDLEESMDLVDEPRLHEADDEDAVSTKSGYSSAAEGPALQAKTGRRGRTLPDVVEDSEWEGVEVIE